MENQQQTAKQTPSQKKKFKLPRWTMSLGALVLVIAIVVSAVLIVSAARLNPGIRVLDNYIQALQRGNVRNFVSAFEPRGQASFDEALDRYTAQVNQFNRLNRDSGEFEHLWERDFNLRRVDIVNEWDDEGTENYIELIERNQDMDFAMDFYVERQIARNIEGYSYEILINDPNVIQIRVIFQFAEPILPGEDSPIPNRYWDLEIGNTISSTRILNFRRYHGRWVFADEFRFFRNEQRPIPTWYNPITIDGVDGYELMHVNWADIDNDDRFENGRFNARYNPYSTRPASQRAVIAIGNRAFAAVAAATAHYDYRQIGGAHRRLTEVMLNEEVRRIGVSAFEGLFDLQRVLFYDTDSDTSAMTAEQRLQRNRTRPLVVNDAAFRNTRSMREFTLSHTANPVIPNHAFAITITTVPPAAPTGRPAFVPYRQRGLDAFDFMGFSAIGHYAFRGVGFGFRHSLTGVAHTTMLNTSGLLNLYDGTASTLVSIGEGAFEFANVQRLTTATWGDDNPNLLPDTLSRIGANAFRNTRIQGLAIPEHFNHVPVGIVDGVAALNSFRFNNNIREIGARALRGTAIDRVDLPRRVEHIGTAAFEGTQQLYQFNFHAQTIIRTIGQRAFYGSTRMSNISLPNTIRTIGSEAFYGATHLRYVMLDVAPTIVLGSRIFSIAQGIPKVYINVAEGSTIDDYQRYSWAEIHPLWRYQVFSNDVLYNTDYGVVAIQETGRQAVNPLYPNGPRFFDERVLIQFLSGHGNGGAVDLRQLQIDNPAQIGGPITAIATGAFARDLEISHLLVNSNRLTWIGADVFYGTTAADGYGGRFNFIEARTSYTTRLRLIGGIVPQSGRSVTLDATAQNTMWIIDGYHLYVDEITNITSIRQGFDDRELELRRYARTGALADQFDLRHTVGIANSAFYGRDTLGEAHLGGVRFVGDRAFAGTTGLEALSFGAVVAGSGAHTIADADMLGGGRVLEIGFESFARTSDLSSVDFPASVQSIGDRAFYGAMSLRFARIRSELVIGVDSFVSMDNVLKLYIDNFRDEAGNIRQWFNQNNWIEHYRYVYRYYQGERVIDEITGLPVRDRVVDIIGHQHFSYDSSYIRRIYDDYFAIRDTYEGGVRTNRHLIQYLGDTPFPVLDTAVVIPSVNTIGAGAFAMTNITRLIINTNITRIDDNAFFMIYEDNLTNIDFMNESGVFGQGISQITRIGDRAFFENPNTGEEGNITFYHLHPHPQFTMGNESFELSARMIRVRHREHFSANEHWRRYEMTYDILLGNDDPSITVGMRIVDDRRGEGNAGTISVARPEGITQVGDEETVFGRPNQRFPLSAVANGPAGFAFRGWMRRVAVRGTDYWPYVTITTDIYDSQDNFEYTRIEYFEIIDTRASYLVYFGDEPLDEDKFYGLFERIRTNLVIGSEGESNATVELFAYGRPGTAGHTGTLTVDTALSHNIGLIPNIDPPAMVPPFYRSGAGMYVVLTASIINFTSANIPLATFGGWTTGLNYETISLEDFDGYLEALGAGKRVAWESPGQAVRINLGTAIWSAEVVNTAHLALMTPGNQYVVVCQALNRVFVVNRTTTGITLNIRDNVNMMGNMIPSMIRVFINDQDARIDAVWM